MRMSPSVRTRTTSNVDEIFGILQASGRALSAYQILDELGGTTIRAPIQVYRALALLVAAGKVHRVESINAFVLCDRRHTTSRPGFLICKRCGTVQEFDDAAIEEISDRLAEGGISVDALSLEVSGSCSSCRAAA
jgi:Fur family zinc uptake transcriptional regulator